MTVDAAAGSEGTSVAMTRNGAAVITSVDAGIETLLGWRPEDVVGQPSTRLIHPEDQPSAIAAWMAMISAPGKVHQWRGRYQTASGAWRWVETTNVCDGADQPTVRSTITAIDAAQASAEEQLLAREQLLTRLADALPLGVFQIDVAGHVTFANDQFAAIVGDTEGATIAHVLGCEPVDGLELRLDVGGAERVCRLSIRPLTDSSGAVTGAVGCISDETERSVLHRELERLASVDELTGCLNRRATLALLGNVLQASGGAAVVFVDLDGFKTVNDRYGHAVGDRLLIEVTNQVRTAIRDIDTIGRLGGDEFVVVLPKVATADGATAIATRIHDAVRFEFDAEAERIAVSASVGAAWTTSDAVDELIACADHAMYEAKRSGVVVTATY